MNYNFIRSLTVLVISASLLLCCKDEQELPKSSIAGVIKNQYGDLLDSAECRIDILKLSSITKEDGLFAFSSITIGKYAIQFSRHGYVSREILVELEQEPKNVEVILSSGVEFLTVSDSIIIIGNTGGVRSIKIESNAEWVVKSSTEWIKTSVNSSNGNKTVQLTIADSDEDVVRESKVRIRSANLERTILVQQDYPLKLLSVIGTIGNYENEVKDSVEVFFNKTITEISITPNYQYCSSNNIEFKVHDNRLAFNYDCARLAEDYPFTVTVSHLGEKYVFHFIVKFYNEKATVNGSIQDYFIKEDNSVIWAVSDNPNQILKISSVDFKVLNSYPLDFEPYKLEPNAYDNSLNIVGRRYNCIDCPSTYIYNFNPNNGLISSYHVLPIYDSNNMLLDAARYPVDLQVMSNGVGAILTQSINDVYGWRFIDFSNNGQMYLGNNHDAIRYQYVKLGNNKDRIYLMHYDGINVDIIEKESSIIKTYNSPLIAGRPNIFIASQKSNHVFHGQLYEQFISDLDSYLSNVSYLDTRSFAYGGSAFSNLTDENEIIYYASEGLFMVLDYKNGLTLLSTDISSSLYYIQTTSDGQRLIGAKFGDKTTDFYSLKVDQIRKNSLGSSSNPSGRKSLKSNNVWVKK